ncbi:MAG: carbon-nitrogen family hydrolase [bacterium]
MRFQTDIYQLGIKPGKPAENFDRFLNLYQQNPAPSEGLPRLIVLPELWLSGYDFPHIRSRSRADFEQELDRLSGFARHSGCYFSAGSVGERAEGNFFNTSYLFDPGGKIIGKYRKQKLFPLMDEPEMFKPGGDSPVFDTPLGKIGVLICYDLRFPELAREMVAQGAQIMIFPSEFPHPRLHHFRTLLLARAIENQVFVLAANRCGADSSLSFCGHSSIIDPWGNVMAEAGAEEEIISAVIDLDLATEVRRKIPALEGIINPV